MADLAIACRGVTKEFGAGESLVRALRGIDIDVPAGELLMIVGPSGCGKTTLISIVAAILDATAGECRVLGEDLRALSPSAKTAFRRDRVGFVFQAYNLVPALSALENAAVPLLIRGERRAVALARARELLERVGLGHRLRAKPSQLSGGEQQRVAIARAIIHQPRLVVCDEPTSALDHETGEAVMRALRETAAASGRTLVIVTHDARIFRWADRIARMDDGRITAFEAAPATEHA